MFFTSNEEALSVAEELTKVYKGFEFRSFSSGKDYGRNIPPNDVLNYPGAGFLTKVIGRERSTIDYRLVWYEGKTRTEYYYVGEDFLFKHGGQIDIPRDIKEYIRLKCKKRKNHGKRD